MDWIVAILLLIIVGILLIISLKIQESFEELVKFREMMDLFFRPVSGTEISFGELGQINGKMNRILDELLKTSEHLHDIKWSLKKKSGTGSV